MKKLVTEYFDAFASKDVEKLKELYADDVSLRDWLSSASGKEDVLESNRRLFAAVTDITINQNDHYSSKNTVASEIDLVLRHNDGTEDNLLVVDVIEFKDGKIKEIRAYLGNIK